MSAVVATRAGELVGAIPLEPRRLVVRPGETMRAANQTSVAVRDGERGSGLGTVMQDWLCEHGRERYDLLTVYRSDPESGAYRWYLRNGFRPAMHIRSLSLRPPYPSRRRADFEVLEPADLGGVHDALRALFDARVAGYGGYVDRAARPLQRWLPVHPYATRYRYFVLLVRDRDTVAGYAVVGVGRLHSTGDRVELLEVAPEPCGGAEPLLDATVAFAQEAAAEYVRVALAEQDPLLRTFADAGFLDEWGFDMLIRALGDTPANAVAGRPAWIYHGIEYC